MNRLKRNFHREGAPALSQRGRAGALVSALAAISALVGVLIPGVAGAAGIAPTADEPPPSAIIGGWRVTGNRALADGGATTYHYERRAVEAEGTTDAEVQWHRASAAELGQQLQAQGFVPAGTLPTRVTDQRELQEEDWAHIFTSGTAQVYVYPAPGHPFFQAIGVWEEAGWTYALSARVGRLYMLERLLERVERLNGLPGGKNPFESSTFSSGASASKKLRRARRHLRRKAHRAAYAVASRLAF